MAHKCCFCGKDLDQYECNSPEPLCVEGACCGKCDKELVWGTRRVIWRPFVDRKTQNEIIALFRALPLDILRQILPEETLHSPDMWQKYMEELPTRIEQEQKERGAE